MGGGAGGTSGMRDGKIMEDGGVAGEEDSGRGGGAANGSSWRRTRTGAGGEHREEEMGFRRRMTSEGEGAFGEAGRWPEACQRWRWKWSWRWR